MRGAGGCCSGRRLDRRWVLGRGRGGGRLCVGSLGGRGEAFHGVLGERVMIEGRVYTQNSCSV